MSMGGPSVFKKYLEKYKNKQTALYYLVLNELFDKNFAHMLQFSMGSVYSQLLGTKLEKPRHCSKWPNISKVSSVHLQNCKGVSHDDIECQLEIIRQAQDSNIQPVNSVEE